MPSDVYNDDFYAENSRVSMRCAQHIVPLVYKWFKPSSVVDVGCSVGAFLRTFRNEGVDDILGLDGDYVPREKLCIAPEEFRPTDLSAPFSADRRYDLVMCLEVGEHLDARVSDTFVQSLCQLGDVVVFSAAIPLQMGDHHVNEQWQSYWVERFISRGYLPFDIIRPAIWTNDDVQVFYKQNMLVFANDRAMKRFPDTLKGDTSIKNPKAYDLVHPDMYAMRVGTVQSLSQFIVHMADTDSAFRVRRDGGGSFKADPVAS